MSYSKYKWGFLAVIAILLLLFTSITPVSAQGTFSIEVKGITQSTKVELYQKVQNSFSCVRTVFALSDKILLSGLSNTTTYYVKIIAPEGFVRTSNEIVPWTTSSYKTTITERTQDIMGVENYTSASGYPKISSISYTDTQYIITVQYAKWVVSYPSKGIVKSIGTTSSGWQSLPIRIRSPDGYSVLAIATVGWSGGTTVDAIRVNLEWKKTVTNTTTNYITGTLSADFSPNLGSISFDAQGTKGMNYWYISDVTLKSKVNSQFSSLSEWQIVSLGQTFATVKNTSSYTLTKSGIYSVMGITSGNTIGVTTVKIDKNAPKIVEWNYLENKTWYNTTKVPIMVKAIDNESRVAYIRYRVGSGDWSELMPYYEILPLR